MDGGIGLRNDGLAGKGCILHSKVEFRKFAGFFMDILGHVLLRLQKKYWFD
jgi:hypothetical protein